MSQPTVDLRSPYRAAFLAWLVPGLGHFYQGRTGKGWLYAICILGLYFVGFVARRRARSSTGDGSTRSNNPEKFCLYYLGQFFVGLPALPGPDPGDAHIYFDKGPILWGFMAEPPQNVINGLHPRLGKLVEIGTIYTTVAGLLNILAIYDAFEGPAYRRRRGAAPDLARARRAARARSREGLKAGGSA